MGQKLATNNQITQRARVTVSFSRKYNVAQYESLDVHVGLSKDQDADEDLDQLFDNVEDIVQEEFEKLCRKIEGSKKENKK